MSHQKRLIKESECYKVGRGMKAFSRIAVEYITFCNGFMEIFYLNYKSAASISMY